MVIFLCGNKTDLQDKRAVTLEEGEKCALEHNVHFIETSAKTSYNIKRLFKNIAQSLTSKLYNTMTHSL